MKNIKILSMSILVSTLIFSCSPSTNSPNTPDSSGPTNQSSADLSLSSDEKAAFALFYENENLFTDTELIASQKSEFKTMSLLDTVVKTDLTTDLKLDTNIIPQLPINLDVKAEISSDLSNTLGRYNFVIKTTNVSTAKNSDGSSTKAMSVDFASRTSAKVKTDTISMVFNVDGTVKTEHNLSANFDGYTSTSNRKVTTSGNNKVMHTTSKIKLSNGTMIDYSENRNNTNTNISGSGTIDIKKSDGTLSKYSFTSTSSASGQLIIDAKETSKNTQFMVEEKIKGKAIIGVKAQSATQFQNSELNTEFASETYATVK